MTLSPESGALIEDGLEAGERGVRVSACVWCDTKAGQAGRAGEEQDEHDEHLSAPARGMARLVLTIQPPQVRAGGSWEGPSDHYAVV